MMDENRNWLAPCYALIILQEDTDGKDFWERLFAEYLLMINYLRKQFVRLAKITKPWYRMI